VLQRHQGVIGCWQGLQDLIKLALGGCLLARLSVLDDEDHGQGERADQGLEDDLPPRRKPDGDADQNPHHGRAEHDKRHQRARRPPVHAGQQYEQPVQG